MKKIIIYLVCIISISACTKDPEACFTYANLSNQQTFSEYQSGITVHTGDELKFYVCTVDGESYSWNFGDNTSTSNSSVDASPRHIYTMSGTYTVSLTITEGSKSSIVQKAIVVQAGAISNNMSYNFGSSNYSCTQFSVSGQYTITGVEADGSTMTITLPSSLTVTAGSTYTNANGVDLNYNNAYNGYNYDSYLGNCTIHISTFSATSHIIAGTFSGKIFRDSQHYLNVTSGEFQIAY